ncbi:DUF4159 domain-containing protein [Oceanicella actignis]|uniref:N-terminal double-transmembrane domain-containing protein n=1 Tax=Oceanicella actignis TaxID=1189325 RepID=A0A1M7SS49_9RHOB|nr:DUF4159 domain-containing protein [Oceanicella actignis]SES68814.1 N-terminal double-transmembrane domain-containing protein [Oceanicella actignis]SHN61393.1 N-terminal double-transmembrane domain-containing protein [Oceanicella actignis]
MLSLGAIAFLNPWALVALAALPALWLLLRATPPAPRRVRFAGVRLLAGLRETERTPDRTPWWLLALRMLLATALILAFAEPVSNPRRALAGGGTLLIALDGGWASAPDWEARRARAAEALDQAARAGRPAILVSIADPGPEGWRFDPRPADDWRGALAALAPRPWAPPRAAFAAALDARAAMGFAAGGLEILWLTDGLAHEPGDGLAETFAALGPTTIVPPATPAPGLRPPALDKDGALVVEVVRAGADGARAVTAAAIGRGPDGVERRLGVARAAIPEGAQLARLRFDLPLELRNRVERVVLLDAPSAGGAALADDALRRRRVGLAAGRDDAGAAPLVSPLHYLRKALEPTAELVEGGVSALLAARPDAIILADVGAMDDAERQALTEWVRAGGLLVRFAGPRLARAAAEQASGQAPPDPLLPVRLRAGGRELGGALSWSAPQHLRPFPPDGPFAGLEPPSDVEIRRQVLAQPGPDLARRTLAALEDGAPLVTAADLGAGRVVLFHVTADAEWSSLPLSGLFVRMLERLALAAPAARPAAELAADDALWKPLAVLDGFGRPADPGAMPAIPGKALAAGVGPGAPPGIYAAGERRAAVNVLGPEAQLVPAPPPPLGVRVDPGLGGAREVGWKGPLLGLAAALLALDALAALLATGRLRLSRRAGAAALAAGLALGAGAAGLPPASAAPKPAAPPSAAEGGAANPAALNLAAVGGPAGSSPGAAMVAAAQSGSPPPPAALRSMRGALFRFAGSSPGLHGASGARPALAVRGRGAAAPLRLAQAASAPGGEGAGGQPPARRRPPPDPERDARALAATRDTTLAYVRTGDPQTDRISEAGLRGLSRVLAARTAVEPGEPMGVDLEGDDLAFFPLLYWPVATAQPRPSDGAYARLNAYLRAGGMIVFDLRDPRLSLGADGAGPGARALRRLAGPLDLPPLEPVPRDHVLTRTFYLLDDFPGRRAGERVWIEAAPAPREAEGRPFRILNDGVSPVVIGANDWAGAWAVSDDGAFLLPVGRAGERRREMAFRFGVNLVMYALTGSYKSDQVHVPALLERLGN